jgi:hypothetical protein
LDFEFGHVGARRVVLEDAEVDLFNERLDLNLLLVEGLDDALHGGLVGNEIADTDTERRGLHVLGDDVLEVVDEIRAGHGSEIVENAVKDALGCGSHHGLFNLTADPVTVANLQDVVGNWVVAVQFVFVRESNGFQNLGKDLVIGNAFALLTDGFGIYMGEHHQHIHRFAGGKGNVGTGKLEGPEKRILVDTDNGGIGGGANNLVRNSGKVS